MDWFTQVVLYVGIADAVGIMAVGTLIAVFLLIGRKIDELMSRVVPAVFTLVGTHIVALLVLHITRFFTGT